MSAPGLRRVWGLIYRHLCLYRRSWPRLLELAYWPTLELLIWGFTAQFVIHGQTSMPVKAGGALIGGVLLWEVALRAQMGVTISFLEEIWSRNLGHVFVSPLRPRELIFALLGVSVMRTVIGLAPATAIAFLLYAFNLFALGPALLLFFLNLLLMGWWMSLGVIALLFRYGASAEALAWTLAFGVTPIACVFYPVSVLPVWLRPVAQILPASHIFGGMRSVLYHNAMNWPQLAAAFCLNLIWMVGATLVFAAQFRAARVNGALISIGE
ncbi:ABC transporter permease [Acidiphilium sp. AL]|uniref:ABC transporter permease n=1 Tax=Acidiphilium iwatense TaxID=768198 RepID=A0ABS9DT44_9PROT|nr:MULTISPECIES: ABC transporter permease [Acidiphilium]MCF3945908.1 ABC transporter permease [Acidiphilium iwatense]MCU4159211.1 ABC transporter permease [Acidiphilium sp. AL]